MNSIRRARQFFSETSQELRKSVWPTGKELRDSTIVILIASILLGAYIALADFAVYSWIELITVVIR